jgi:ABC-type polysaccharide/polyol phosphate transport system ATPase subunit
MIAGEQATYRTLRDHLTAFFTRPFELTGRENIYHSGAILGMKRAEIARKFDEIVSFAEVEKFIDTPPSTTRAACMSAWRSRSLSTSSQRFS